MVAARRLTLQDLQRQKRLDVDLSDTGALTPQHSVGQAVEHYRSHFRLSVGESRWTASSRGLLLDSKLRLGELPEADSDLTVIPEVSAGVV